MLRTTLVRAARIGRLAAPCTVACLLLVPQAMAQSPALGPRVPTWSPAGVVGATLIDGDTLYVGGSFDQVGPPTGSFATISAADASAVSAAATPVKPVVGLASDGHGGWYVAAEVDYSVSVSPTIDHVLADGSHDPQWVRPRVSGVIHSLAVDGNTVFVGGYLDEVNGARRSGVAAFDGATGALLPWDARITEASRYSTALVLSLAVAAGRVYVSGVFSHVASVARESLAVVDATTAALLPYYTPPSGPFTATDSRMYVGTGAFDLDLHPIPGYLPPFELTGPYAASANAFYATEVILGVARVVAVDPATGARLPFTPVSMSATSGFGAGPGALAVAGGRLYVGGSFGAVHGAPRFNLAAVDASTGAVLPWAPIVGPGVTRLAVHGSVVAAGGMFNTAGGQPKQNLAAIDLRTGRPTSGVPDVPFAVQSMLRLADIVVVAGSPAPGSGVSALAFSIATGTLLPWGLQSSGTIATLATDGRYLFFGGDFTSIGGLSRRYLAAFDLQTLTFSPWAPAPDLPVVALAASGGTLFVSSPYRGSGDSGRRYALAYDVASGAPLPFSPPVRSVRGFAFHGDRVLLGGTASPDVNTFVTLPWVDRESGSIVPPPTNPQAASITGLFQRGATTYVAAEPYATGPNAVYVVDGPSGLVSTADTGYAQFLPTEITASADYIALGGRFVPSAGAAGTLLAVFHTPRSGAPQRMRASVVGSTVTLQWTPGAPPAATSFLVEAGSSSGATDVGVFGVGASTAASGALPPGAYYTRVRGVSESGPGAPSSEVIVTVPAVATPPNTPGTLTAAVTGGVAGFTWGAASGNATTYVIEAGTAPGLANLVVVPTGTLDTSVATPAPAGTYYVRVRAANAYGVSAATNEVRLVVP